MIVGIPVVKFFRSAMLNSNAHSLDSHHEAFINVTKNLHVAAFLLYYMHMRDHRLRVGNLPADFISEIIPREHLITKKNRESAGL
jgi:hypothetical protein